jgi:hypothetical protein
MPGFPRPGAVSPSPNPPVDVSGPSPGGPGGVPGPARGADPDGGVAAGSAPYESALLESAPLESALPESALPDTPEHYEDAARAAYEASIMAAFGGRRGLAEVGLPTIVFVAVYTPTQRLDTALWAAVAVAAALTVLRLVRRDKIQQAVGGVVGVVVCALFAKYTGQAKNFYLLGVLYNAGEAIAFCISALVRWPLVGVVIGPITGEMAAWRKHPERLAAFTKATWMLTAMFVLRVVIEVPLYLGNLTTELGAAKVLLGYPLYLFTAFLCWQVIRKAPPPVKD